MREEELTYSRRCCRTEGKEKRDENNLFLYGRAACCQLASGGSDIKSQQGGGAWHSTAVIAISNTRSTKDESRGGPGAD